MKVFKLFYGARIAHRRHAMNWGLDKEKLVLQLLREEFAYQINKGMMKLDSNTFNSPKTPSWPTRADTALHTAQIVPASVVNFAEMKSR